MVTSLATLGIGPGHRAFVIAEAGVNHNGNLDVARRLVREAREAGADCVKFQTFRADRVATAAAPKAAYQLRVTDAAESQIAMLRALEFGEAEHRALIDTCRAEGIRFLSTPYDLEDAEMLAGLGVEAFKLASIHLVEVSFLRALATFRRPLILSTGMATLAEVDVAVRTLRGVGHHDFAVLQCTTNYPSRIEDANLRAMGTMRDVMGVVAGYSDHTDGIAASLAAVALGASVIEKHFTLDRTMPGPDHACSSDPGEFRQLVRGIRDVEAALGTGIKAPCAAEIENTPGMRRSIVARRPLVAGATLAEADLAFKRPGTGISPARIDELIGRSLTRDVPADRPLDWADVR